MSSSQWEVDPDINGGIYDLEYVKENRVKVIEGIKAIHGCDDDDEAGMIYDRRLALLEDTVVMYRLSREPNYRFNQCVVEDY